MALCLLVLGPITQTGSKHEKYDYYPATDSAPQISVSDRAAIKVAEYTEVLAWLTFVLAAASIVQGIFLLRGDKTARIAAEAAKASADALPAIERAHVFPVIVGTGAIRDCVLAATVFDRVTDDLDGNKPCDMTTDLSFKIKNYGKTPAILKQVFAAHGVYPLGTQFGIVIHGGILGAGESTDDLISVMERGLTRREAEHVLVCTKHVAFVGQILFDDIWGNEYRTEFEFDWEHSTQLMQISGLSTKQTRSDEESD